jgi:uracil phosphoribosyltransferase
MDNVRIIDHPLLAHKLTCLRDQNTNSKEFRRLMDEMTQLLVFDCTRDLKTQLITISTPMKTIQSPVLLDKVVIVPVLRAGLGMEFSIQQLIPTAKVAHVGMFRDPITHLPRVYYQKFPSGIEDYEAIVVDPLLATGGSIVETIKLLKKNNIKKIRVVSIIGVKEGIQAIHDLDSEIKIYLAALDPVLNDNKYIEPGLGDAGDRLFGTK